MGSYGSTVWTTVTSSCPRVQGPAELPLIEAARLLAPLPHALLLQTENSEFYMLCTSDDYG